MFLNIFCQNLGHIKHLTNNNLLDIIPIFGRFDNMIDMWYMGDIWFDGFLEKRAVLQKVFYPPLSSLFLHQKNMKILSVRFICG
jgi:hypothetical protein